jgi:hypothetical protein
MITPWLSPGPRSAVRRSIVTRSSQNAHEGAPVDLGARTSSPAAPSPVALIASEASSVIDIVTMRRPVERPRSMARAGERSAQAGQEARSHTVWRVSSARAATRRAPGKCRCAESAKPSRSTRFASGSLRPRRREGKPGNAGISRLERPRDLPHSPGRRVNGRYLRGAAAQADVSWMMLRH